MKKLLSSFLFSCTLLIGCSNSPAIVQNQDTVLAASTHHTTQGDIRYHKIPTKKLKTPERDIVVYLPPSYNKTDKKYPVLYMHDGQNIFDKASGAFGKEWYVDEKLEYLIEKNVIDEIIVVGVYNGLAERINEYTWTSMPEYGGGEGKRYAEFLVKDVKPFIDKKYRTKSDRNNTAVAGSSLGGLISFYLSVNYQNTFSKIGIMSPSFWWNDGEAAKEIPRFQNKEFNFWLDCGDREGSDPSVMVNNLDKVYSGLKSKFGSENVMKYVDKGAGHNEEAWATRIHAPIIQFFGREKDLRKKENLIKRLMVLEEWGKL